MNKENRINYLRKEINKIIAKYSNEESQLHIIGRPEKADSLRVKAVNKVNSLSNEIAQLNKSYE